GREAGVARSSYFSREYVPVDPREEGVVEVGGEGKEIPLESEAEPQTEQSAPTFDPAALAALLGNAPSLQIPGLAPIPQNAPLFGGAPTPGATGNNLSGLLAGLQNPGVSGIGLGALTGLGGGLPGLGAGLPNVGQQPVQTTMDPHALIQSMLPHASVMAGISRAGMEGLVNAFRMNPQYQVIAHQMMNGGGQLSLIFGAFAQTTDEALLQRAIPFAIQLADTARQMAAPTLAAQGGFGVGPTNSAPPPDARRDRGGRRDR
ncbi:hypothetical protein HK097_006758, partial [Rhizophlyctis rosea]